MTRPWPELPAMEAELVEHGMAAVTVEGVGQVLVLLTWSRSAAGPVAGMRIVIDAEAGVPVEVDQ
jgi:hypothetical protein